MNIDSILEVLIDRYSTVPVTSIGKELSIDWTKLNAETLAHLVWHGTKQKANDPNGAKDLSDSEKEGNSRKVLDSLEKNEVRMAAGRIADPFESEVMRLAVAFVANRIVSAGGKLKDYKTAEIRARAAKALNNPNNAAWVDTLHATATANLAAKSELLQTADVEI